MNRARVSFAFLNVGHFLDHLFMLVFASVVALRLTAEWNMTYAELIPYATPGFVAFGVCALLAGWLADKWSREGMMVIFFLGIGLSSVLAGMARSPLQMGIALTLVGVFAAIYHPVGLAMVVQGRKKIGIPLAVNGVFGNLGVACAALVTGFLIDWTGWRSAFIVPGLASIGIGALYLFFIRAEPNGEDDKVASVPAGRPPQPTAIPNSVLLRVFGVVFFTTAIGGLIFQSTTFSLPKVFEEELAGFAGSASQVGGYAFLVFALAAFAQLAVGHLVDNHPVRPVFFAVALLQVVFFFIMTNVSGLATLLIAIGFMLVVFGQIPINDVLIGRVARNEWRSRAYAVRYIVTFTVMASAVPFIAWVHGSWGFSRLFLLLGLAASLIFAAIFFLPASHRLIPERSPSTA